MRRLALLLMCVVSSACAGTPAAPAADKGWLVGTSSRSVLPTVDGGHGYAAPERLPPDADADDPGVFAAQFDQGPITVGNGKDNAHWVRDDLRVRTLAVQRAGTDRVVVIASADVYMVFRPDAEELRRMVRRGAAAPSDSGKVEVLVHATHNHHGPDTAFAVNPEWYRFFLEQTRDAVKEAVERLEPATLRVAEGTHYFGGSDLGGLRVFDPTLGVLQARAADGRVIATLVNWANHPESTLNWSPPRERIAAACKTLGWDGRGLRRRRPLPDGRLPGRAGPLARPSTGRRSDLHQRRHRRDGLAARRAGRGKSVSGRRLATATRRRPMPSPRAASGATSSCATSARPILVGEQLGVAVEGLLQRREATRRRRASTCVTSRSSRGCPTSASASWRW